MSEVPVFVSMPTKLNDKQTAVYETIKTTLKKSRLFPSTVGRSTLPLQSPLGEVFQLARRCSGGLILGFRHALSSDITRLPGSQYEKHAAGPIYYPSPWNQLEAGMLFALGVPMLILAEEGVTGGIFDRGVGNLFIHEFSAEAFDEQTSERLGILVNDWARHVVNYYMEDSSKDWRR